MNENIDLTKILDGCPKGTEFYSSIYGKLKYLSMYISSSASKISFEEINSRSIIDGTPTTVHYYRDGRIYPNNGECTLFPSKDQRDWSKFERFWDKPKVEKFDPKTLQPFDKILVRNSNWNSWVCDLFSHIKTNKPCLPCFYPIVGLSFASGYCVPYNEETKHLIGTTDDCPEYYKWWEE